MNKFKYIIMALAVAAGFSSCSDDDGDPYPGGNGPVTVNKVYLEDNSDDATVAEREVTFARLGQTLRLEGSVLAAPARCTSTATRPISTQRMLPTAP